MSTVNLNMTVSKRTILRSVAGNLAAAMPRLAKRTMDLTLTTLVAVVAAPIMLLLAVAIKLTSRGPIFYCQKRIGQHGQHFYAWKMRTMVVNADKVLQSYLDKHPELREEWERDHKLKNDPRVTLVGRFLRKTSLDELPQIWNVLRGDMSLVGPRPIVDDEIEKYGDTFNRYKRVLPGITGLWQVSGRNNTTYQQRVDFDDYYVQHWSVRFDLYILLRTVRTVLLREGAY